jgi:hypothetical protein
MHQVSFHEKSALLERALERAPCSLQASSILILSRGAGQGFVARRGSQQAGRTRMKARRVQMRSSLARFCFAMGLAIFTAPIAGFGSDPAIAQDVEIAKTDFSIDAVDPGIKLFLRDKMAAGNTKFTDDNIVLFLHGATSPRLAISTCPTRIIPGPIGSRSAAMSSTWATIAITAVRPAKLRWTRAGKQKSAAHALLPGLAGHRGDGRLDQGEARRQTGDRDRLVLGAMMAGYYASLHSENVRKLVLYAPLYNFNDHTNLGPGSGLQNKRKPLEFNFALGAYRLVPETANTARWNGEIPLDNKDEYRDPALPAEFWKACLATDPTTDTRTPASLRAPNGVLEDSFYQATGRPLWNAANIYAPTLVIAGQYDTWSYLEDREGLMRDLVHVPVKQSVLIPDATHFVLFEKNRIQFFDAILKFLKE